MIRFHERKILEENNCNDSNKNFVSKISLNDHKLLAHEVKKPVINQC